MTRHISSEKARANWRKLLDAVGDGEEIVIERYGQPIAVLSPYQSDVSDGINQVHEPGPVYDPLAYEQLKTEVVTEVLAEMEAAQLKPLSWQEGLAELQRMVRESGSPFAGMTTDQIVAKMRETRREIVEEMYGHLY